MGAHPRTLDRIRRDLYATVCIRARHVPGTRVYIALSESIDQYLDVLYDYMYRATSYDARQWGFRPDRWMYKERTQMYEDAHMYKGLDGRWYTYAHVQQ